VLFVVLCQRLPTSTRCHSARTWPIRQMILV
jgi:hypothetical protein